MGMTVEVTSYQDAFAHFDKEAFFLKLRIFIQAKVTTYYIN